jgi:hypothetical protein
VALLAEAEADAPAAGELPLILHGLAEDEVAGSVAFLEAALARTGQR